jgi:hypothetical protein
MYGRVTFYYKLALNEQPNEKYYLQLSADIKNFNQLTATIINFHSALKNNFNINNYIY